MKRRRLLAAGAMALALVASIHGIAVAQGPGEPPTGQLTWGLHFSPTPTLYEPAETPGLITPFMFLYALHDALAKPMPGKSVPDPATRLAMLKTGEADIVYGLAGEIGEEVRRTSGLTLKPTPFTSTHWLLFADQWDQASPWHDRRVRLAATHAVDRQAINQAENLGFSKISGRIIPISFDFYWQPPAIAVDPAKAKQLLAEAGYPKGFDAGDFWCDAATSRTAEAALNYLQAAGIKTRLRPLERAGFMKSYQEKKLKNIIYGLSGIAGNAATRIEPYATSGGIYAYGGYPDIDGLFKEQVSELDHKKREAVLHRVQQLIHEKVMFLPIWQLVVLNAQGSRVAESGLGLIADYPWSAPYEDVKVKAR